MANKNLPFRTELDLGISKIFDPKENEM